MASAPSRSAVDKFFASLSLRSRVQLYTSIFFLVAPIGLLASWQVDESRSPWAVAGHILLSGLAAAGGAAAIIHNARLLFVIVPVHFLAFMMLERFDPSLPGPIGAIAIALIALGYVFVFTFITGEGVSKLRLQTEITLAQDIHRDLVPPIAVSGPRLEIYGRSTPSSEMGGDLLDVVEREGRTVVCVADVAGHGVPAGVVMGMMKSAVRTRLLSGGGEASLLTDLDAVLGGTLRPGMFVTCACAVIDESRADYASAGHLPLLRVSARSGSIERLSESGLPLGTGLERRDGEPSGFEWRRFEFLPGDLLVLLTDGITEVFDRHGREFGLEPLENILRQEVGAPLAALCERLERAARAHGPQTDDQTMILVRRLG